MMNKEQKILFVSSLFKQKASKLIQKGIGVKLFQYAKQTPPTIHIEPKSKTIIKTK